MQKPIKVTLKPPDRPPSREQLGELAEKLLEILARAEARKLRKERTTDGDRNHAA